MKKKPNRPDSLFSLEDHKFLEALGISGLPEAVVYGLTEQEKVLSDMERIEKRADGLISLELDEAALTELEERHGPEVRDKLKLFRDLKDLPPED